jgi:periplasmic copper chaperone A
LKALKSDTRRRTVQRSTLKTSFLISVFSVFSVLNLLCSSSRAQSPPLKVAQAWIQAVPGTVSDTAAFMTLTNSGKSVLRLVGAATPIAGMVHPMITTTKGKGNQKMMGMESTPALDIPPGGTLVLAPGGNHLMIMGLKRGLKAGETVPLTLKIEPGNQELPVNATVAKQAPGR